MTELTGRLRTRLGVERWRDLDEGGLWTADGELWAEMAAMPERTAPDGGAERRRPRFRLIARPGAIDETCRLIWAGRTLSVLTVRADPVTPDRIEILAEERQ
ncbi:MAG: head-tail adaptor protein [Sphingomonadaceae bacterium]|nr:head-tail adaptor protein [Sphingomonadaceae bacterium]